MKTKDLVTLWGAPEPPRLTPKQISIRLPILVSAKLSALQDIYPSKTKTDLIGDLLTVALVQLEKEFPRIKGEFIDRDPNGRPYFEDNGVRSGYLRLTEKYLRKHEKELGVTEPMEFKTDDFCYEEDK